MVGETIGNYRIVRQIGVGGMATVYGAQHQVIGRKAAVKVLQPQVSRDPDILARFYNEARVTAQIGHPGLVEMLEYGQHASGSMYIIMEYLEGETLMSRLKREGKLSPPVVAVIIRQVASAVGAAHAAGVTHRDLKPENVFLVPDRNATAGIRVKVLDFGVAKLAPQGNPSVKTQIGAMLGTPQYFSPEQCQGAGTVDYRSDIYSLGCIMYELLTGKKVFYAQGLGELLAAHQRAAPPTLRQADPSMPAELDALLARMLAKRPADRPQSLAEVEATLAQISAGYGWDQMWTGPIQMAPNPGAANFQSSPGGLRSVASMHPSMAASMHPSMAASMHPSMAASMYPSMAAGMMAAQMQQQRRGKGRTVLMALGAVTLVGLGAGMTYVLTRPETPAVAEAHPAAAPPEAPPAAAPTPAPAPAPAAEPTPAPAAAPAPPVEKPAAEPAPTEAAKPAAAEPEPAPAPAPAPEPAPAPAPPAQAAPAADPPAPVAAAAQVPAKVKLKVTSEPAGAHVYRGEERIGVTPLEIEEPRGDTKLELILSLSGHPDARVEIPCDQDGEISYDFSAKPALAGKPAPAAAPPKSALPKAPPRPPAPHKPKPKVDL